QQARIGERMQEVRRVLLLPAPQLIRSGHHTFSSRCSRSHELITCMKTSLSASFTMVKAATNGSPSNWISSLLSRRLRSAESSEHGSENGRSCAQPVIGSEGLRFSSVQRDPQASDAASAR